MTSGLLLIDKPTGITSFDVIRTARKTLQIRKMGHAGTLDPFASGLMIVAVGEATKVLSHLLLSEKEYVAEICFGATSTTDDSEGTIVRSEDVDTFLENDLEEVMGSFRGRIDQVPPVYSALKVNGRRACDRVRAGENMEEMMEQKKRTVHIAELEIVSFAFPMATVRVRCSSGTYIRSLARDIGSRMGVGAYLENLRRTHIGDFSLDDAVMLDAVSGESLAPLRPDMFSLGCVMVDEGEEGELRFGRSIEISPSVLVGENLGSTVVMFGDGVMVGFGEVRRDGEKIMLQPRKLLRCIEK